jgi:hypothetical protein
MILLDIITVLLFFGVNPACDGYGICRIEHTITEESTTCSNCVKANLETYEGGISIAFNEKEMKDGVFLKYFTKESFEVYEDYPLPKEIAEKIGFPNGYTIQKGKYSIHELPTGIVLYIK